MQIAESVPLDCPVCAFDIEQFCQTWRQWEKLRCHFLQLAASDPLGVKQVFRPGRVVVLRPRQVQLENNDITEEPVYHLAVILKMVTIAKVYQLHLLTLAPVSLEESGDANDSATIPRPVLRLLPDTKEQLFFLPELCAEPTLTIAPLMSSLECVTSHNLKLTSADRIIDDFCKRRQPRFQNEPPSKSVQTTTQELQRLAEKGNSFSELNLATELRLSDPENVERARDMSNLKELLNDFTCLQCPQRCLHMRQVAYNLNLRDKMVRLKWCLSEESLALRPEYRVRLRILKQLRFVDALDTVELKGRVACEMSSHEVLLTELLVENALDGLEPEELAAVLSAFVFEQRRCAEPDLTERLQEARQRVEKVVKHIVDVQNDAGLYRLGNDMLSSGVRGSGESGSDDNDSLLCWGLAQVVLEWARKRDFRDIATLTDVQEGIIVRTIQRLDELLKDVRNAARIIGDPGLRERVMMASQLIKRDIVFAASLYTQ